MAGSRLCWLSVGWLVLATGALGLPGACGGEVTPAGPLGGGGAGADGGAAGHGGLSGGAGSTATGGGGTAGGGTGGAGGAATCPDEPPHNGGLCFVTEPCTYSVTPSGCPAYTLTVECRGDAWQVPIPATCGALPNPACDPVGEWTLVYDDVPGTEGCLYFGNDKHLVITASPEGTLLVLFGRSSNNYDPNWGLLGNLTSDTETATITTDGCQLTAERSIEHYYGEYEWGDEALELTFSGDTASGQVTYSVSGLGCGESGTTGATATR